MTKDDDGVFVVINTCYGGFSISRKAAERALEIAGKDEWAGITRDYLEREDRFSDTFDSFHPDCERTDPVLVQVVRELGEKANSKFSKLRIWRTIKGQKYRIQEYDGMEHIETPDDINWNIA